jgi:uncharacterized protein YfiM (DUF2279 family)
MRKWFLRTIVAVLALLVLLLVLTLGRTPWAAPSPPPTARDVNAARSVYQRVRVAQAQPGERRVNASWEELGSVAGLGGRAMGVERVAFDRDGARGRLTASLPLPFGFWLNGRAFLASDDDHDLKISGRVGYLPVPAFLAHGLFALARQVLRMRGAEIPSLRRMVSGFDLDDQGLGADVDLPRKSRFFSTVSGMRSGSIDADRVAAHYCRLVEQQRAEPSPDVAVHVRRAFSAGDGSVADNRSAFVALAILTAGTDVGSLPAGPKAIVTRCGTLGASLQLLDREDLVKHWAVSAALTSVFGPQASMSLGTWKEVSDSGAGGSGFSLVDLAADRSGVFIADHGAQEDQAESVRKWLAAASQADLLPVSALALAEGMTEEEFKSRFASTDSSEFASTVQRIDDTLAVLRRY